MNLISMIVYNVQDMGPCVCKISLLIQRAHTHTHTHELGESGIRERLEALDMSTLEDKSEGQTFFKFKMLKNQTDYEIIEQFL